MSMERDVLNLYKSKKPIIDSYLDRSKSRTREEVWFELCFCLLTPQSKANLCRSTLERLRESGKLFTGTDTHISKEMTSVRFCNNKAKYIVEAREKFDDIFGKIIELRHRPLELREYLVKNVKGYGYKESSHFLRNIGLGDDLAILDRHVLRYMKRFKIKEPKTLSRKSYLEYEKRFLAISKKLGLKAAELDSAIWLDGSGSDEIM